MGIVHFMPLGTRPGAVTAALSYLKRKHGKRDEDFGSTVEAIVLFTTKEIKEGVRKDHRSDVCVWNSYGKLGGSTLTDENAFRIVVEFISREMAGMMTKPTVYWCEAFADDYKKSFRSAAEAIVLDLSKPESKGKNIWVNLTGGTNIMNAALMEVALLSGLVSRVYYTFVPPDATRYLQPTDANFTVVQVPLVKTAFDEGHHSVLDILSHVSDPERWTSSRELLSRLKGLGLSHFHSMDEDTFVKEYLTQMDDRGIKRRRMEDGYKTSDVRITDDGREILVWMDDPIIRALTRRGVTARHEIEEVGFTYGWAPVDLTNA